MTSYGIERIHQERPHVRLCEWFPTSTQFKQSFLCCLNFLKSGSLVALGSILRFSPLHRQSVHWRWGCTAWESCGPLAQWREEITQSFVGCQARNIFPGFLKGWISMPWPICCPRSRWWQPTSTLGCRPHHIDHPPSHIKPIVSSPPWLKGLTRQQPWWWDLLMSHPCWQHTKWSFLMTWSTYPTFPCGMREPKSRMLACPALCCPVWWEVCVWGAYRAISHAHRVVRLMGLARKWFNLRATGLS